jgi:hypothetical protein
MKKNKPPPAKDSDKADQGADTAPSADEKVANNALRPPREGPDNLAQRAEWFRRRTGGGE